MKEWLKVYKDNYEGKSPEANEIAEYVKETYNGASYIPWATMERLTYMQDPNAKFEKIRNEKGGLVHTDSFINENCTENKEGIVNKTSAAVVSHFVKVSVTFMGKEFVEEYPIQEQDYSAAKVYNQNLVNRALQRALAKVASRATGLGLRLYENKDLQFEEKEEEKPVVKKTTSKGKSIAASKIKKEEKTEVVEEPTIIEVDGHQGLGYAIPANQTEEELTQLDNLQEVDEGPVGYPHDIIETCELIKNSDKDKMVKILQSLNTSIMRQHKFTISVDDDDDDLCEKLSHFSDVTVFAKAIQTMLAKLN